VHLPVQAVEITLTDKQGNIIQRKYRSVIIVYGEDDITVL
jgi:hypothetical protein